MNSMVIISLLMPADEKSLWQHSFDVLFNIPFWTVLSVLMIPVFLILFRRKHTIRTVVLVVIGLFLWTVALCQIIPGAIQNVIASKQAWQDSPASTAFLALIGTVVAPLAFFLVSLYLVRRTKSWMQNK